MCPHPFTRFAKRTTVARLLMAFSLVLFAAEASAQSGSRGSRSRAVPSRPIQSYPAQSYPAQSYPAQGYSVQGTPIQGSASQGSVTRGSATQGSASQGSASQGTLVALSGYCPVCIIDMKQWMKGSSQHQVIYDGKAYFFPNDEIKQKFVANPGKYIPALGGDCTVCLAKMGKRMPGSVHHAAYHNGRLYLFPGADQKRMFVENPSAFENVDLAMKGTCSVCLKEMGKEMPGDPQFAAYHNGMRYLFPGEDQLKMFLANPAKYAVGNKATQPAPLGGPQSSLPSAGKETSSTVAAIQDDVTFTGTSTCAGCEHGVTPLRASDTLGLGIELADGKLVVVEDAHERFPDIYKARFKNLSLTVHGRVIKQDGNVCWIEPTEVRVLN